ncbi:hypothetical protein [Sphingobium sp.]|uniref:hypothetical protein n=1 Tax=Sphingobium sp. TaxID=1912891 RepID=UPI002BD4C5F7|nr:hypothetical protein [Sphingobium sp.]HUD95519.1 hypothetical protein [Sphingobium sp.]
MARPPVNRRLSVPGQSSAEDRLLAMVAALASELAMTRERLDTLERLADASGMVPRAAIEEYTPDAMAAQERDANRQRLIAKVFRPLKDDAERAAHEEEPSA